MSRKAKANILLLITSVIWGASFVAQKAGAQLAPFTYNGLRTMLGCIFLLPLIPIISKISPQPESVNPEEDKKNLIKGGLVCGLILAVASNLQQFGMFFETDAGKAGFITALYIVIVPVLGVFLKKRVSLRMWICVMMGALGFYFLTLAGKGTGLRLEKGDFFVLLCALGFSFHILAVDHFSPKCNGVKLSCAQFFVAGSISIVLMFIFESPKLSEILSYAIPIMYSGIMSSGIGYTLQILAQRDADPTTASLIMSLESVFAVLSGAVLMGERLTFIEGFGCIVIFAAVIISQLPEKDRLPAR